MYKKFLLILSLIVGSLSAQASGIGALLSGEPDFLPVNQAFRFSYSQSGDQLILNWQIEEGYYLYRKQFKLTSGTAKLGNAEYPEGTLYNDEYFGETEVYYDDLNIAVKLLEAGEDAELTVRYQGCAAAGLCYPPKTETVFLSALSEPAPPQPPANSDGSGTETDNLLALLNDASVPVSLGIFFVLGIGLAFTPCVFPMYPILSGLIVGQGDKLTTRRAFGLSFAYVQGMAITYSLLGLVVATAGLHYQAALQHPAVLIGIGLLFVALAAAMFGLFQLQLPASLQLKLNNLSNRQRGGSTLGVFTMGTISGLVASPCTTAPLSGALLYVAQTGDLMLGGLTLYVLSLGMGIPLMLIGTSGGKLLPKAGAWMNVIKHLFGFALLGAAIFFINRLVNAQVEALLWSALGIATLGYLVYELARNSTGLLRPTYIALGLAGMAGTAFVGVQAWQQPADATKGVAFIQVRSLPELQQQIALAADADKPVMLDLYADWCVACKEFEHKTFAEPSVKGRLANFVLIQADVTENNDQDIELLNSFGVLGLPTLMFFDREGKEQPQHRVTGFQGPRLFGQHLDTVLSSGQVAAGQS